MPYEPEVIETVIAEMRQPVDEQVEARRILRAIDREAAIRAVEILVRVVTGERAEDVAREFGLELNTINTAKRRARMRLSEQHGREFPPPPPPRRKGRKKR